MNILEEVKQTGLAIRYGRPMTNTAVVSGLVFYHCARRNCTVYTCGDTRLAQQVAKGRV